MSTAEPLATQTPPGTRRTPERPCLNCGDTTPGNYCRVCGQRKIEVRVSLRRMLMEALDDQFSLNSALPRTVVALFLRPGHLTREYMNGRIARYIPPFRLYLVSSVIFFLILSFTLNSGDSQGVAVVRADTTAAQADSVPGAAADSARGDASWLREVNIRTGVARADSVIARRTRELSAMESREAFRRIGAQFMEYVPQTIFLLLPVFAGILKLLYLRRGRLYVEHFVFALHLHAFTFLCLSAEAVLNVPFLEALIAVWLMVYTYVALYRVYGQGWFRTLTKYWALGFMYLLLQSVGLTLTLLAAILLM